MPPHLKLVGARQRVSLERSLDPRAVRLIHALEQWLPRQVAWERAAQIAARLLRWKRGKRATEKAIREGLFDLTEPGGDAATRAVRAWEGSDDIPATRAASGHGVSAEPGRTARVSRAGR
jgi:hypothetical protein